MKVQITADVTDDQRIALGLIDTGLFIPAKREQIRPVLEEVLSVYLADIGREVTAQKDELRRELLAKLTDSEAEAVTVSS